MDKIAATDKNNNEGAVAEIDKNDLCKNVNNYDDNGNNNVDEPVAFLKQRR